MLRDAAIPEGTAVLAKKRPKRLGRRDFGSIKSDGPARFSAVWWEGGKQRRKRGFTTRDGAEQHLAKVRASMADGTLAAARRAEMLFTAAGDEWLKLHSKTLRPQTHRENEIRWNHRIEAFFSGLSLAAITSAKVLEFKAALLADGALADGTRNQYLQQTRAVLRYAVAAGYLTTAPTERIRGLLIRVRRAKLAPPIERAEDVGRLLEEVRTVAAEGGCASYVPLVATAVYTGLRRGELCGLRWADVDLDRRLMTVRHSHDGPTKSGEERIVPIASALLPFLAEWKLAQGRGAVLVFPNDRAGKWGAGKMHTKNSAKRLRFAVAEACKRAKLPVIRFHDLRHVYASHFVMNGGDLLTLQRILGHSTPTITSEVYSHLAPSHLVKESDRVRFTAPESEVIALSRSEAASS